MVYDINPQRLPENTSWLSIVQGPAKHPSGHEISNSDRNFFQEFLPAFLAGRVHFVMSQIERFASAAANMLETTQQGPAPRLTNEFVQPPGGTTSRDHANTGNMIHL